MVTRMGTTVTRGNGETVSVGYAVIVTLSDGSEEPWVDEHGWDQRIYDDYENSYAVDYSYEIDGEALRIYSTRWTQYLANGWSTWYPADHRGEVAYYPAGQWRRVRMGN